MVDFYRWLTNNNPKQKINIMITTLRNDVGYFGLRFDEDDGWSVTDGLLHPENLKNYFIEIDYPKDVSSRVKQKLFKTIFKGSVQHI